MDFDQPMFEDVPREHPQVYMQVIKDSKASALCVAALAFASGLARGVAVINPQISDVVNFASMAGVSPCRRHPAGALGSHRLADSGFAPSFAASYPIATTVLVPIPLHAEIGLSLFAGLTYMAFSLVTLIMMMQCAQTSRYRGINPVFVYEFFGSAAYIAQGVGFLLGWFANDIEVLGVGQTALLSIVAAYVLGMALFVSTSAKGLDAPKRIDRIEFLHAPAAAAQENRNASGNASAKAATRSAHANLDPNARKRRRKCRRHSNRRRSNRQENADAKTGARHDSAEPPIDATLRRNRPRHHRPPFQTMHLVVREKHGLSSRETEVMELVARGKSMASIAEEPFISENTVRTHCKHIYSKLDIHSRQELSDLVSSTKL